MRRIRKLSSVERLEDRVLFARALGIDVSGHQTAIDWSQVKASGRTFAWTKATEGVTFNDSTYTTYINAAKNAGVLIGAYHYARYDNNTASAEVSHFLSIAGNQIKAGFLRPMLDVETAVTASSLNSTKAQISQWVNDWCNGIYNSTGVKPIVYTYVSYASTYLDSTVTQWPLWMAQYPGSPDPQNGAPSGTAPWASSAWQIWQYSSTTPVLGIGGTNVSQQCDVDVFNGDATAFSNAMLITSPVAAVTQGANTITDGQSTAVDFGSTNVGGPTPTLGFTIKNTGGTALTLSGLNVPSGYTIGTNLTSPLAAGGSETFTVSLGSASVGTKTGNISFTTNDPNRNPFNFPVTGLVTGQAPPSAPTNLGVSSYTSSSVSLSWMDNSNNETGFVISRRAGLNGSFVQVGTTAANVATFTDSGASGPTPNTSYYYHVQAAIDSTLSNQSNDVILTTLASAPTNVSASDGIYQTHITLSWNPVSGVNKYAVYRSTLNDPSTGTSAGTATTSSFDDTSAAPNTTYYYWMASYNSSNVIGAKSAGDSGFSDTIPPMIAASAFQEFSPPYLSFTFSEPVAALGTTNVSFANLDSPGGATPAIASAQWLSDSDTERFYLATPIPDGNFRATLTGAQDAAGNALTGSNTEDFFFLTGDANADRTVNTLDFNALATNFGASGAGVAGGDFNLDGTVDTSDFTSLATQWAATLPAAPMASPLQRAGLFSTDDSQIWDLSTLLDS